jgi:hypothetical protein
MAKLALDRGLVGQEAESRAIEPVRFEHEHGLLKCLGIIEHANDLTDRLGHDAGLPFLTGLSVGIHR